MVPAMKKKRIVCDAADAEEAMEQRYNRHEALSCLIGQGIKDGIATHNKEEQERGCLPATPPEVRAAIIEAITRELRFCDEADVQAFIVDLKACLRGEFEDWLDGL